MDVYDEKLIGWGIDYLYIWINGLEEKILLVLFIIYLVLTRFCLKVVRENYIKLIVTTDKKYGKNIELKITYLNFNPKNTVV